MIRRLFSAAFILAILFAAAQGRSWAAPVQEETPQDLPRKNVPKDPKNLCEPSDSTVRRAAQAVLRDGLHPSAALPPVKSTGDILYYKLVSGRVGLLAVEEERLRAQGMLVLEKLPFHNYAEAYDEIHQSQLPVFISVDSILHALFASHQVILEKAERNLLMPLLVKILDSMAGALPSRRSLYPPEIAGDIDLYLALARSLLAGKPVQDTGPTNPAFQTIYSQVLEAKELKVIELFGRERMIDFSQFTPRGHYTDEVLSRYFRAAIWLSRLEFNLVSRSCRSSAPGNTVDPSETPREAVLALALADLAQAAQVLPSIDRLDAVWRIFAGKREDVSFGQLLTLKQKAGIGSLRGEGVYASLKSVLGDRYRRTVNFHPMPEGTRELPAICTFLGPRIVPDASIAATLVVPSVPDRHLAGTLDFAAVLGSPLAETLLKDEIVRYPQLKSRIESARTVLRSLPAAQDLYTAWLKALLTLGRPATGPQPRYAKGEAYAALRLNTMVSGFAELRHTAVLMAAQNYDIGGCRIPDGYVEGTPEFYQALLHYVDLAEQALKTIDPQNKLEAKTYFDRVRLYYNALMTLVRRQEAGLPPTEDGRRFLAMICEINPMTTGGGPASNTGWYFDLYFTRSEAFKDASLIVDLFTSTELRKVSYAGTCGTHLGLFLVDTAGPLRLMVGPVSEAFSVIAPLDRRLTDADIETAEGRSAPWRTAFAFPLPAEPDLSYNFGGSTVTFNSLSDLGEVEFALLDHNRSTSIPFHFKLGPGKNEFALWDKIRGFAIEMIYLRWKDFQVWKVYNNNEGTSLRLGRMKNETK